MSDKGDNFSDGGDDFGEAGSQDLEDQVVPLPFTPFFIGRHRRERRGARRCPGRP